MRAKESLKVGVVGCGQVAQRFHIPSLLKIKNAEAVAVCDRDEELARRVAKRFHISRYYADFSEMLGKEELDMIDICTPPATHLALTIQALEAGCNVLLEKPMAMTLEDSEKIIKVYTERKDKRLKLGVIHNWLFEPLILNMLSKVKKGEIGDIINVDFKALGTQDEPMLSDPNHWCHSLPGGRFGESLIHPIYLLYRLLGNLDMKSLWVAKRGLYPWVAYDELFVTFSAGKSFGSIYNSRNSPMNNFPVITIYGTKSHLRFEGYNWTLLARRPSSGGAFKKGINILHEIYQLSRSLSLNMFNKVISGQRKTGHEIYFSLFIDSLVNNKELPLTPEEAYEANKIFLKVLSELEKLKPWKPNPG